MNKREQLLRIVSGDSGRERIVRLRFGRDILGEVLDDLFVDSSEVEALLDDGQEDLFLFGTRPETRDSVLRDSPCLVRQPDGRFQAQNTDKRGPVFLVD